MQLNYEEFPAFFRRLCSSLREGHNHGCVNLFPEAYEILITKFYSIQVSMELHADSILLVWNQMRMAGHSVQLLALRMKRHEFTRSELTHRLQELQVGPISLKLTNFDLETNYLGSL